MQFVFFEKGTYTVYNGIWDKSPRSWGIFVLK